MIVEQEISALRYQDPKKRVEQMLADDPRYPYKKLVLGPSSRKYAQAELFDPCLWGERFKPWTGQPHRALQGEDDINCNRDYSQFGRDRKLIRVRKITSKARWSFLAQLVRYLCMSVEVWWK